jgi:hypothetical protein
MSGPRGEGHALTLFLHKTNILAKENACSGVQQQAGSADKEAAAARMTPIARTRKSCGGGSEVCRSTSAHLRWHLRELHSSPTTNSVRRPDD